MKRQRKASTRAKEDSGSPPVDSSDQQLPLSVQSPELHAPQPTLPSSSKKGSQSKRSKIAPQPSVSPQLLPLQQPNSDATLEERIRQSQEHLRAVEKQIFTLETLYFESANPCGNAIKGYDNLFATNAKKAQLKDEDRIFSGSSVTGQLP